jgi:hypothetical protein
MMARSNFGFAASLGELVELLDEVSFGSASTTNNNASDRVSQHSKTESINNAGDDTKDNANSGIRKASSYPVFCTNKAYLARHHVCMVDITWIYGELEDVTDEEEERDEHGNPNFDFARLNLEGRSHTPSEHRPPWCSAPAREASSGALTRSLEQGTGRYRTWRFLG